MMKPGVFFLGKKKGLRGGKGVLDEERTEIKRSRQ
jgi:hypothetical protein